MSWVRATPRALSWKISRRPPAFRGRRRPAYSLLLFYEDAKDHAGNATVAFTIREGRLYTLRERELPAFRLYRMRARSQTLIDGNAYELLLDLFETKIEQLADEIENIYSDLEKLSRVIMEGQQGDEFDQALSTLAELEDIGWKVRLCLMDTQRALNFPVRKARLPTNQLEQAREILRDIESLLPHNESLFQKVNFLMQAAMGFINIEQNRIIKIFSVVSVVFLPPTLVASSYGMNFEFMPELKWSFGYPAAIGLMISPGWRRTSILNVKLAVKPEGRINTGLPPLAFRRVVRNLRFSSRCDITLYGKAFALAAMDDADCRLAAAGFCSAIFPCAGCAVAGADDCRRGHGAAGRDAAY